MPYAYRPGRVLRKFRPSPAAVVPGEWDVSDLRRDGVGRADVTNRKMEVPMGPSDSDYVVRTHEMAHVAFTPPGERMELVRAILPDADPLDCEITGLFEDARVNHLSLLKLRTGREYANLYLLERMKDYKKAEKRVNSPIATREDVIQFASAHVLLAFALPWKRSRATNKQSKSKAVKAIVNKLLLPVLGNPFSFREAVLAARKFKNIFLPGDRGTFPERDQNPICDKQELNRTGVEQGVSLAEAMNVIVNTVKCPTPLRKDKLIGLSYRPQDSGVVPKFIHRIGWGPVFTNKIRHQGGALLLDCSGSMHLDINDVLALLKQAPLATIAMYSGDGRRAEIRVVAKGGKVARPMDIERLLPGINNTCDVQALEWLGKQPGPRLWISDGQVNGKNGKMYPSYTREANRLMVVHNVTRAENIRHALEMMERRKLMVRDGAGDLSRYIHEGEPT